MKNLVLALASCCLLYATAADAYGGIVEDLANAIIVEEFLFDDPSGTDIPSAVNNAGTGHMFDFDADTENVLTNGAGQLNVSLKNNTAFGTNYVDNDNITTGRVFGVMELTWDFDTAVFDPDQDEEIRITLTNNDPRGSEVTAEFEIQRNGFSELVFQGNAVGGDALGPVPINLSQPEKFIAVVDADLDNDVYSVHFSADAGTSFTSLGPGAIDPLRIANAMRMVLNEDFVGDNVLIDRVYLATIVPEPGSIVITVVALLGLFGVRKRLA